MPSTRTKKVTQKEKKGKEMTTELKWYTRNRKHPFSQKEGSNGEIKKTYNI